MCALTLAAVCWISLGRDGSRRNNQNIMSVVHRRDCKELNQAVAGRGGGHTPRRYGRESVEVRDESQDSGCSDWLGRGVICQDK